MHTAHLLLQKIIEFAAMTPDKKDWHYEAIRHNPPRAIRYRQIEALMKAFLLDDGGQDLALITRSRYREGHDTIIEAFLSGNFIYVRNEETYAQLWEQMMQYVAKEENGLSETRDPSIAQLAFIFPKMMDYRQQLYEVMTFNSGWLEAGFASARYSIYITDAINKNLEGKEQELDQALCLFIDPKLRSYTMEELVQKFNYPTENLQEIDMDNM
jgi:hypothetical protein